MRTVLLLAVGITWLILTAQRVILWTDDGRLWADAVQQAPLKPRPWLHLGASVALQGDTARATRLFHFARGLARSPERSRDEQVIGQAAAEVNLALLAARDGRLQDARNWITHAQARLPGDAALEARAAWIHSLE